MQFQGKGEINTENSCSSLLHNVPKEEERDEAVETCI